MRKYRITFDQGCYFVEVKRFLVFWELLKWFQTYEEAEQYIVTRKLVTYYDKNGNKVS